MTMLAVGLDDTVADLLGALRPLAAAQLGCTPEDLPEPADYRLADGGLGEGGYRRLFERAVIEGGCWNGWSCIRGRWTRWGVWRMTAGSCAG